MNPQLTHLLIPFLIFVGFQNGWAQEEGHERPLANHEIISWSAGIKCAQNRYPKDLYEKAVHSFSTSRDVDISQIHDRARTLIESSTTHRQAYRAIMDRCPEKRTEPKILARSHEIYQTVQCMALQGLSRRDWQRRVQDLHKRYRTSPADYVSVKIELMEDPFYQTFSHQLLREKCPSEVQKRRLILERKTPLPNGRYVGTVLGVKDQEISVEVLIKNKVIVSAEAQAFGRTWPLRARSSGSKVSLSGKDGARTLFFQGRMRSSSFKGRFYARIKGADHKGRWTATRSP